MTLQNIMPRKGILQALALAFSLLGVGTAQTTPPDLTAAGAIAALKTNTNATPVYGDTFNLGPTGLRGWIHCSFDGMDLAGTGRMTNASRQILVTTASTPGSAVLAVDDVILGAIAANSGTVPSFTSDARKAFATAITDAEKTGAGTLRVKRWRGPSPGTTTDVNISIATLGDYSATAPYNCPKSSAILASTRSQMMGELLANSNYLDGGHSGAINALALLASVPYVINPSDPNESTYSQVRTRLQTYARSITIPAYTWIQDQQTWIWHPAYQLIFLSEYYFLTNDTQVLPIINGQALWLAEFQSMFGTFGHGPGALLQDASGRRFASGYGPVNACGNIANMALVLAKKALLAAGQSIDPKIDTAIQRATGFLGSYVNKGAVTYGEHLPYPAHPSNGKNASAAVFFGLQAGKAVETEYFSRLSIAGWAGVEVGHAGQELGLLWAALGAAMGGETAASEHFKQLLWRYDLTRRTNGSFVHDSRYGTDFYGGSSTDNGTYLGNSAASGVKGTAIYLLTYSLPLKQLFITGKNLNPAYILDATKAANSAAAAYFRVDRASLSTAQLFTYLGDYDPIVRSYASETLATKSLSSTELTTLRGMLTHADPNLRQSAAETLGILKDSTALSTLVGMLHGANRDPDHWVRQKVAAAIRKYDASALSTYRDTLINAFLANAPADPNVIDWTDPLQFSNSTLAEVIFTHMAESTINAPKETLLYPAIRAGLRLPTGAYRSPIPRFARTRMNLTDLRNMFPELVMAATTNTPADQMFSGDGRRDALAFMVENNITEGVEIAYSIFSDPTLLEWGSSEYRTVALNALVSYGDAARYALPRLKEVQAYWNTRLWDGGLPHAQLRDTIAFLENVTAPPPPTNPGKSIAHSQIVTTTGAKAITLTGASPRGAFTFQKLTDPAHGTLTGTAPNFTYTPNAGFTGTDKFTFQTTDSLTTSATATVAIVVGTSGTGLPATYYNNADFTSPVLNRTDAQINFDWGTGSPDPSIAPDTFSTRWSGYLLVPETGTYQLSSLTSDGVRAFLNGSPVINNLNDQSARWTDGQTLNLTAGQKVPLLLEYYEDTGSAVAKLKWTGPGFAGPNGDIIPQTYLFESNSSGGTDTTNPVISTLSPADNATGVAHAADLVATFSENIVAGTGNITLRNTSDNTQIVIPVTDTAQVAIAGSTLIINPTVLLTGSKNYAVRIDATAIDDTAGNSFAGIATDTVWNFTTTAPDLTAPTPNPMSFAVRPITAGSTSISMTATTASDPSGVEYRFNNLTLGTSSPWQNSPVLTATGLSPSTNYIFTVQARDKSVGGNTTTASAPASARTLAAGPLDVMSVNFYAYGPFAPADQNTVTLEAGESAGLGIFHVSGWQNYAVPWGPSSPAAPYTLTSSIGSTATMILNDVRNGWTHRDSPHTFFAGGDGDLMGAHANGTEDPYDQSALFNMDVSNITYPSYDLIVYLGANEAQFGDGKGKVSINGGAAQDFTLRSGEFSGFVEITDDTTPGNYIVFRGLTAPSLNLKVWGNGFNHMGPAGFQIVNYGAIVADTTPPAVSSFSPADDATGVAVGENLVATFSESIAIGTGNITLKNLTDGTQTNIAVTDTTQVSISGAVLTVNPSANLLSNKSYAVQIAATAIKDLANNNFAGVSDDTTWNFATPDTTAPTITSRNPADGATGVAVGANLVATFSEPIAAGTGNITIRNTTASPNTNTNIAVTDTTQITISGSVLTINPTADLLPNTSYAVRIATTAIDDIAGNSFAGISNNTNWNFTTGTASADSTAPTPNPMTFESPPAAAGPTSISMTATDATDPSGVEYRFNNVTLATSSPWQDGAAYTATGLNPATSYSFTVEARDKSPAQNTTAASGSASATTQNSTQPMDRFNVNLYSYGEYSSANYSKVTLEAGESAGVGTHNVTGWQNIEAPFGLDSPMAPVSITSNLGLSASFTLKDLRNGWTYDSTPNTTVTGGNADLMNSHANATEDPYDGSNFFDMEVTGIPYQVYDLIVYLGANQAQYGDGTGKLVMNGGPLQNFTLTSGEFSGFTEITNATTPGNYIVFRGLRNPSLTLKVWGNGFNHLGPTGFQIVKDVSGVIPPGPAGNPNPPDGSVGHAANTDLSWTGGLDATSRNVYFGTNPTPGASELRGTQTATTYDPGNLANGTYYWRIDEINADGTTPGPVWSFSVGPPSKAFRPMPWNGMGAVATNVGALKWVAGASATPGSHDVYFGTDSTPDATEFIGNQSGTTYNPGTLIPGTTYYWRIDQVNAQGATTGDVWSFTTPGTGSNKVKIFILAGQSNMEGQGEMAPGTTPGTLQHLYDSNPVTYAHLKSGGNWAVRSDVWAWFRRDGGALQNGDLTAGYGANTSTIGPELQFGHVMGDHYGQKVLLIKTAWGGKSLRTDFRPPSSGWSKDVPVTNGDEGYYFKQSLDAVVDVMANLQTYFPTHNPADGYEIAGFGWHQGWNDRVTPAFAAEYEVNMARFIRDVRSAVGVPAMPFVIGTTGMDGNPDYSEVELAQLQMENFTAYPDFNGSVAVVDTQSFWFPVSQSPTDQGYHWNRNAASYYKIGNAMGLEMRTLLESGGNTAPVATEQSVTTVEDTAKAITLAGTDAENNTLTYSIVTQPAHGTLDGTGSNRTYTPAANYTGTDSFTFKANDGLLDSAPATVTITVTPNNQITWSAATAITSASNIQTAGINNLAGANFGIATGTTTLVTAAETGTVDVEFKSLRSGQNVTLSNGINVAADDQWVTWGFANGNSAVTGNFGTVLDSNIGIETDAPVSPAATITLSGLTIGTQYQIQFFADSTGSNSQTITDGGNLNSLSGQFVTGTFTADATSKVLTITRNTDFAVANALTVGSVSTTTAFDEWSAGPFPSGQPLTDSDPELDFDGGSLPTGIEWVVGGDPTDGSDDAALAPRIQAAAELGFHTVTYQLSNEAAADIGTQAYIEYAVNLSSWTKAIHNGDTVRITTTPGPTFATVEVKLKDTLAPDGHLFVRLKSEVTP